ncbi:methyltransferase domain-containing protein [Geobacter luticola]|uniref:Methyltransferase domain-containing protein n=2 Tax=Geomobilimonas luticola TaxID=1114878 RepID=A0ABS5SF66_9BACT|nr:methyltransferase domain-containing protein [Geomobilimonas luticola]
MVDESHTMHEGTAMQNQWTSLLKDSVIWKGYDDQHSIEVARLKIQNFIVPQLQRLNATRILEVGCGSGVGPVVLRESGFEAYGIDPHFKDDVTDTYSFLISGEGKRIPFPDRHFDLVYSLETIEHVGTRDGMLELAEDYQIERRLFIRELCRVSSRHVIITTPNKYFPVDEHHVDMHGNPGFRVHSPFENKTLSARELRNGFREFGFELDAFLNPRGYYQLERVKKKFGRIGSLVSDGLLRLSSNRLIGGSFLNPHLFLLFRRLDRA